jgi:hypothetical protein
VILTVNQSYQGESDYLLLSLKKAVKSSIPEESSAKFNAHYATEAPKGTDFGIVVKV